MTTDAPKSESRERWSTAFAAALERMEALAGGLSHRQLNFKPAPDRWSVGQCIDHVSVSMGIYLDPMERILETADLPGEEPYGRGTFMGRLLIGALRRPRGRYKAPRRFRPSRSELDPDAVRGEFRRQTARMQEALRQADGLALGRINMPWPVFGWIKVSLAQAFELQVIHTDRHLEQAEGVTRADGFPEAGA